MNTQNRFIHKQPKYPSKSQQKTGAIATQWNATHQWKKNMNFWVLPKASSQKHAKWRTPDPKQLYAVWFYSHELLRWTAAWKQRCTQRNQSGVVMIQMEKSESGWLQRWWELVQFWKYLKKKSPCGFLKNLMQYARSKEMKLIGSEQKERWNFCWF